MTVIVDFIKQMTIFLIIAKMILHLRPKAEYEKYLKLVVGIMVLAMVMETGIGFVRGGGELLWEEKMILWERILSESY